ncbi:MAG: zf-HC2 domain-containing protein [Dokdonella sp.]
MSTTLDNSNLAHRQTWNLIPWVVNGSATPAERQIAETHLAECVDCRDELAFQSLLHAGMAMDARALNDGGLAFARLMTRIEREDRNDVTAAGLEGTTTVARVGLPASRAVRRRHTRRRISRLLVGALALQSVGLVLLGAVLLARPSVRGLLAPTASVGYQTLSSSRPSAAAPTIRFVPSPMLSVGGLQTLLADAHLRIVDSSQGGAIYGLAPDTQADRTGAGETPIERNAATAKTIARLRVTPGVLLAEPIATSTTESR